MRGAVAAVLVVAGLGGGLYWLRQHPEALGRAQEGGVEVSPAEAPEPEPSPQPSEHSARRPGYWSQHPTLSSVPEDGVIGMLAGREFRAQSVTIDMEPGRAAKLRFSDLPPGTAESLWWSDTGVVLRLDRDAVPGLRYTCPFGPVVSSPHASYRYISDEGGQVSVGCQWACAVEFTFGELLPYDPEGDISQPGGTLSGQVSISFDDRDRSWVAGSFTAEVRYRSMP